MPPSATRSPDGQHYTPMRPPVNVALCYHLTALPGVITPVNLEVGLEQLTDGTEPGFAIYSMRAAKWVVWPTAV